MKGTAVIMLLLMGFILCMMAYGFVTGLTHG